MGFHRLLLTTALACSSASGLPEAGDACQIFFLALKEVPHQELTRKDGPLPSLWDGTPAPGCELRFVTTEATLSGRRVPDFEALEGSPMYRLGWRRNESFTADGPGTGLFGIQKDSILCLIRHDQPAHLDDSGRIVQSERLTLQVQCRER